MRADIQLFSIRNQKPFFVRGIPTFPYDWAFIGFYDLYIEGKYVTVFGKGISYIPLLSLIVHCYFLRSSINYIVLYTGKYENPKKFLPYLSLKCLSYVTYDPFFSCTIFYCCQTCRLILRDNYRLRIFENRILRRILCPRGMRMGSRECSTKKELHSFQRSPKIFRVIKSRRLKWE